MENAKIWPICNSDRLNSDGLRSVQDAATPDLSNNILF